MKRETIEAKDKEFCDKLCELRKDLAKRQELAAHKKGNIRNPFRIAAPVLIIILLAAYFSVGKTTPNRQPKPTVIPNIRQAERQTTEEKTNAASQGPSEPAETLAETEKPQNNSRDVAMAEPQIDKSPSLENERETDGPYFEMETAKESGNDSQEASTENQTQEIPPSTDNSNVKSPVSSENPTAEPVESEPAKETNPAAPPPSSADSPSSRAEPTAIRAQQSPSSTDNPHVKTPGSENPTAEPVESEPAKETNPAAPPPSSAGSPSAHGEKIARKSVCSGVQDHECVAPLSRFSLDEQTKPYFWMEVHSDSVPYVLKHVYYREGRKYTEVPLEIRHPRMRTWSKITLNNPEQAGSWRVQIETEDGVVLGSGEFQIVRGDG